MNPHVTDKFGFDANQESAEGILLGNEPLNDIEDKYLRMVLEAMRRPEIILKKGMLSGQISLEEHISAWKKQKRRTSSERSQLTFDDFKAAVFNKKWPRLI